jgi:hypothetical protein
MPAWPITRSRGSLEPLADAETVPGHYRIGVRRVCPHADDRAGQREPIGIQPGKQLAEGGDCALQRRSAQRIRGTKLVELIAEGIGKEPRLAVYRGKKIAHSEPMAAGTFAEAGANILDWLESHATARASRWRMDEPNCLCVRVVHGGWKFTQPAAMTASSEPDARPLAVR